MSQLSIQKKFGEELLGTLKELRGELHAKSSEAAGQKTENKTSFADHLLKNIKEVDSMQKSADLASAEIASGKSGNIHETMLAVTQAELSLKLMVQVRNRALEAYQEVMRMPV